MTLRNFDFSSWQSIGTTLMGLAIVTLLGVGIRLVMMMTIQQRRERMNRQINERLKTLIAAYKVLGGSFTGTLTVDPRHLRDLRTAVTDQTGPETVEIVGQSDRSRRIRDAVEAALSDILLLGTEEQVRLAEQAARELVAGRPVHTHELVVSLRDYVRKALDLDPIPLDLHIPAQGPTRPTTGGGSRNKDGQSGAGKGGGGSGGGSGAGMGSGMGAGMAGGAGGMGLGLGLSNQSDDPGDQRG